MYVASSLAGGRYSRVQTSEKSIQCEVRTLGDAALAGHVPGFRTVTVQLRWNSCMLKVVYNQLLKSSLLRVTNTSCLFLIPTYHTLTAVVAFFGICNTLMCFKLAIIRK